MPSASARRDREVDDVRIDVWRATCERMRMRSLFVVVALASSHAFAQTDPASTDATPILAPAAEPTMTTTTPADPTTTEPPAEPTTTTTPTAFAACLALAQGGAAPTPVVTCLDRVVSDAPESLDAVRATAAKTMLEAALLHPIATAPPVGAPVAEPFAPPGRLELVGVAGVFGVWNAIALGVSVSSALQAEPGASLLGTSALSLGAGVGFAVGGYYLGEALDLDEGGGKLVASGIVWGSNMGIAASILVLDLVKPQGGGAAFVTLAPVVGMGYVGGGLGLLAAKLGRFDAAQVSLVNSGGALGSFLGAMAVTNLAANQVGGVAPYTLTYMAGNAAGLVGFGILGNLVEVTWSETLIGDLGMVLGATVVGLGTVGVLISTQANLSNQTATLLMTGATSLGAVGGYAAGLGIAMAVRPKPALAPSALNVLPMSSFVVDKAGALAPTLGLMASF
jgi:hypothetical protein